MVKRGDRVEITGRVAAAFNNNKCPGKLTGKIGAEWSRASPPTKLPRSWCGTVGSRRTTCRSAALNSNQQSWDSSPQLKRARGHREAAWDCGSTYR
jgi:hypothetical protein